jgi:DNA-directed RNA polymerase subunit L
MKLKVLKETDNEIRVEVQGEGHTFCNALQDVLLGDKDVEFAGYSIDHPLISEPVIFVRTRRQSNPRDVLIKAAEKLKSRTKEIKQAFESALSDYEEEKDKP